MSDVSWDSLPKSAPGGLVAITTTLLVLTVASFIGLGFMKRSKWVAVGVGGADLAMLTAASVLLHTTRKQNAAYLARKRLGGVTASDPRNWIPDVRGQLIAVVVCTTLLVLLFGADAYAWFSGREEASL